MNIFAQITEIPRIADHVALQSDRWLFIASLIVMMFGGVMVIHWLVKSLGQKDTNYAKERDALIADLKVERHEWRGFRKEDQLEFLKALTAKDVALSAHTDALTAHTKEIEALTAVITRHDMDMRAAHAVEVHSMITSELERRERMRPG